MRATLLAIALFAVSCSGDGSFDEADTVGVIADELPSCTTPVNCPGGPPTGPPPVDPHPEWGSCASVTGSATASATEIRLGQAVTLSWQVSALPVGCGDPLTLGGRPIAASGSMTLQPKSNSTYSLAIGPRQLQSLSVSVVLPKTVRIKGGTPEWQGLFTQAIATPGTLVLLKHDLELDMSNRTRIPIVAGVTIAGEAPPVGNSTFALIADPVARYGLARSSNQYGPRIFTTTLVERNWFVLTGDNIKLRGFRLQGPDMDITHHSGSGLLVDSVHGIELERLELSGFASSAVGISNEQGHVTDETDVVIHDCFIHHNQRAPGGLGYGVSVGTGAKARIEHNVFDFNRHSITSDGTSGTGYMAYENLVLRGGGVHVSEATGISWHTQSFDVHGTESCTVDKAFDCGPAGFHFTLLRNAFQYSAGPAFKLRGTPEQGAAVVSNVFAHEDLDDAVQQTESGLSTSGNAVGRDTFGKYGVCDFDGDGYEDLFLATGRTWWFAGAGRFHWTFLGSKSEVLTQLGFGDFDGDGRCDVFRVSPSAGWQISSGGTGDWASLPGAAYFPLRELAFHNLDGDGFTDVFRRAPDGQWFAHSGLTGDLTVLASSRVLLQNLRFGDFDADGITDVLAVQDGMWKWSKSGVAAWAELNPRYKSLSGVRIGNFDGLPGDDVLRIVQLPGPVVPGQVRAIIGARVELSPGGTGAWQTLVAHPYASVGGTTPAYFPPFFFGGRFSAGGREALLAIDAYDRLPRVFVAGQSAFLQHGFYPR